MDAFRRTRYAVTLLILAMALFVSAETAIVNGAASGGTLIIHGGQNPAPGSFPNTALYGHGFTGEDVGVFGNLITSTTITTCSLSSSSSVLINPVCAITAGAGGSSVSFNGTFTVGNVVPGDYLITVTGSPGTDGTAQATLVVDTGPVLQLKPSTGPHGTSVQFSGAYCQPSDSSCTVSSPTNGAIILNGGCSPFPVLNVTGPFPPGHQGFFTQNVTGSFEVGNVPEGQYAIQVTGSSGDFAQAIFNVTAGAFIQLGVNGVFSGVGKVPSGPHGTTVSIEGSQFLPNDALNSATCSVSSPTSGSVIVGGACSFFKSTTSPFTGFVNVTGSFTVGNVAQGQYVIQVSGSAGDSAQAVFNVTAGAFIQLGVNGAFSPVGKVASGPIGTHVSIEGSQFLPNDALNSATCSISSPTNGAIISTGVTAACSFFKATSGFVNVTGSFVVGNVAEGQYVIQVSGSAGDSAQAVFNVTAGAFIQLSGLIGGFVKVGQVASGPTGTDVNIEGSQFLPNDALNSATCSVSSPTSGSIITGQACSFFKTPTGFVNVTGSFRVGNVNPGQYVIQVSGSAGDSAQAVFNVTRGPQLILTPSKGPTGIHVSIEGGFFLPSDTTCSLSSPSSGSFLAPSSAACAMFTTVTGLRNVTGSFIVGNVPEGQYVVQVTGNQGDFAQAVFNVTRGPFIQLFPSKGPDGTHVTVEGSYFLSTDTSCSLSSPTSGTVLQGAACVTSKQSSGAFNGFMNVTGSFIVGNVLPGQYVIQVTCNQGDFAQAIFNVTTGPFIQLRSSTSTGGFASVGQVTSGPLGTSVSIEGSYFIAPVTTCTISSPSAGFIQGAACSVFIPSSGSFLGYGNVTGSFIVGNVLVGQYVVQVTANDGSFAQAIFNVTLGAQITLSPATAKEPGTGVIVNGTGFLPTDTACVISSPGSIAVEGGTAACSVRAGTGVISGSFLVGNVLPGQYVIQVTGNQGDFAQAVLSVPSGPVLTLSPGTGMIGTSILVNGTSFLTTDQSCSISSISTPNPILSGSAACAITVGTGNVHGSFIIGSVSAGEYVVEVTGCTGNSGCAPSVGDFAQEVLNVTHGAPTTTLSPGSAVEGSTVVVIGSGLNPSDTGCSVLSSPNNTLITSSTCSIVTPGIAQGTFVVSSYATSCGHSCVVGWGVYIQGTPVEDMTPNEPFTVTPDIIVTPTSGTVNTVFTYTGSGFESDAASCTAVTVPAFGHPTCSIDGTTGQVSGSISVPSGTGTGTYGLMVTDSTGSTATGEFTVGTPSALVVLNPASVDQDEPVGVAGTGFNPNDTYCVITSGGTPPWSGTNGVAPNCAISGGYASGTFVVSTTAPGGYYLISVIACSMAPTSPTTANPCAPGTELDFASNFLGVTLTTTVTTYSTTTTSSSTTTSLSTTTTSVATSFSYSSTTYSTTGILFTTYTHFTFTTVSGQTTTTLTQTTSTTQTQTTVTVSTTTSFTTVGCGPLPCGFAVQSAINPAPGIDSAGLLAALLLLIPMLLRRLFS